MANIDVNRETVVIATAEDVFNAAVTDMEQAAKIVDAGCPSACTPVSHSYICQGLTLLKNGFVFRAQALLAGDADTVHRLTAALDELLTFMQQAIANGAE